MPSNLNKVINKVVLRQTNGTDSTYIIGDIIEGYYNNSDQKFYKDNAFTEEIEGASGFLYVSLDDNKEYRYDNINGFILITSGGESSSSDIQIASQEDVDSIIGYFWGGYGI